MLQSIKLNTSASSDQIFVFVADSEIDSVTHLEYFQQRSTLIIGKIPNEAYPLSALHRALEIACNKSISEYVVCLDTDTVVLQDVEIPESGADIMAVSDHDLGSFWSRPESEHNWIQLYERYDIEFEEPIRWFNGGVLVVNTESDFAYKWKVMSEDLWGTISREKYFTEMVCLGLLSNEYQFKELNENKNYIQGFHVDPPNKNVEVIHYIHPVTLYRSLMNPDIKQKLAPTDVLDDIEDFKFSKFYYKLITSYLKAFRTSHPETFVANLINLLDSSR